MKLILIIFTLVACNPLYAMSWVCFQKTVASTSSPEALTSTSYKIMSGSIQAKSSNTGTVKLIQKSGTHGITLDAGKAFNLSLSGIDGLYEIRNIYLKVSVNGEGVDFCGFAKD